jgi:hypothetical protein
MGLGAAIAVGAAATGIGAIVSSNAASDAAQATRDAAAQNNALQSQIYSSNKETLNPYVQTGNAASSAINKLLGLSGDSSEQQAAFDTWKNATGYQSALKQGQNSVTAALGAKGLTDSGAALKALTQYGQDYADSKFQTYLGNLQTQQATGLSGASALAGVGQNYANATSANNTAAANATGNAALSSANTINSALSNLATSAALASSYGGSGGGVKTGGNGQIFTNFNNMAWS